MKIIVETEEEKQGLMSLVEYVRVAGLQFYPFNDNLKQIFKDITLMNGADIIIGQINVKKQE